MTSINEFYVYFNTIQKLKGNIYRNEIDISFNYNNQSYTELINNFSLILLKAFDIEHNQKHNVLYHQF